MKDSSPIVSSRFPFGGQNDFFCRTLGLIDVSGSRFAIDEKIDVFEKRAAPVSDDAWLGTVPVSAVDGHPADHLEALLSLIVPCDAQAHPIAELRCGERVFRPVPEDGDGFCFVYPVPPAKRVGRHFHDDALAVLSDYVWLGRGAVDPLPTPVTQPDLGARLSRRIKAREVQPLHGVAQSEPFIVALGRYLAVFLAHHEITDAAGTPLHVPFFQLRSARDWIVQLPHVPSANELFAYLSRICNIACEFCYLFGNPETISIARGAKTISKPEMDLRMKLFTPETRQRLFKATWEINEVLVDPKFEKVARELRRRSDETFFFITNGNPLTPARCALLEELKPVELIISTNTIDFRNRSELMHEKETLTNVALGCFEDLDAREICYGISMVAMPDQSFDELEATIRAL
ncbi:radical SAM protein [Limimaricola sp.]|uniref:radical SAM protein n=1 Tax=Limimaricola sp. TaxID=2211665 RepID=UPI0040586365